MTPEHPMTSITGKDVKLHLLWCQHAAFWRLDPPDYEDSRCGWASDGQVLLAACRALSAAAWSVRPAPEGCSVSKRKGQPKDVCRL